ncbi:MAG: RNA polymerase sigma-70 factor (ECF subfamily) [Planctomycetota bacterium]
MSNDWHFETDPLAALRDGDPRPFEAFVPDGLVGLTGFFRRQGAGFSEAEDLAQDVLMRMIQRADTYESQERFAPYVFRVARNVWIDSRRRKAARPKPVRLETEDSDASTIKIDPIDPGVAPSHKLEVADEANRVAQALACLSPNHREVFELGVLQELPYSEIGSLLDVPIGTVKSRMFHAMRTLRELLAAPSVQGPTP